MIEPGVFSRGVSKIPTQPIDFSSPITDLSDKQCHRGCKNVLQNIEPAMQDVFLQVISRLKKKGSPHTKDAFTLGLYSAGCCIPLLYACGTPEEQIEKLPDGVKILRTIKIAGFTEIKSVVEAALRDSTEKEKESEIARNQSLLMDVISIAVLVKNNPFFLSKLEHRNKPTSNC